MLTVDVLYVRAVAALALPVLADVVVPAWLVSLPGGHIDIGAVRLLGLPVLITGCWLLLDSVFVRFAQKDVARWRRSILHALWCAGACTGLCATRCTSPTSRSCSGQGILFQSWYLFVWAAVLLVAFHLFVVTYEEPTLYRLFGNDYETYLRAVGRWIPRRPGRGAGSS